MTHTHTHTRYTYGKETAEDAQRWHGIGVVHTFGRIQESSKRESVLNQSQSDEEGHVGGSTALTLSEEMCLCGEGTEH
eukprot:5501371-Amphidinium_carterae.1